NMAALLEQGDAPAAAVAPAGASAAAPATAGAPPSPAAHRPMAVGDDAARRRLVLAATFVAGCVEGWILTRAFGRRG
ncbi:hypothetical protein, partial [Janibacter melonis]